MRLIWTLYSFKATGEFVLDGSPADHETLMHNIEEHIRTALEGIPHLEGVEVEVTQEKVGADIEDDDDDYKPEGYGDGTL